MPVLVYVETPGGQLKKSALELVTYAKKTADVLGTQCFALVIGGAENAASLGQYGADKVLMLSNDNLKDFDSQLYTSAIVQVVDKLAADTIVLAHSARGKALVGRLAARFGAGSVAGATQVPTFESGVFRVKKNVFSGKAIAEYEISTPKRVISLVGNSLQPEKKGSDALVESIGVELPASRVRVKEVDTVKGQVPLPEAELVVSAGRGMKGPENWGMVEDLAQMLGAATACSRPVADTHWRPHHEHVGQTGVAIRPNLYIAIGISGAIQHLAGVNNSKTIVVINKDPEAPFFKAADYGVCGDLFEVVPRLNEAVKKFKANH
jgi:electron transfer flavoprotein alpha subunit